MGPKIGYNPINDSRLHFSLINILNKELSSEI